MSGDSVERIIEQLLGSLGAELPDRGHGERCARFAAVLFDALADRLQLDPHDRRLAIAAALLHDVGYVRGGRDHHRKSFDVIVSTPLNGIVDEERVIVACAARYHGRSLPNIEHAGFGELDYVDQRRVRRIAAITRVAAALDASHLGLIDRIHVRDDLAVVEVVATAGRREPAVERDRLREATGGFEALTGMPLRTVIELPSSGPVSETGED